MEAETGDYIEVVKDNNQKEQGKLLESYEAGVMLIKLDNGYNIGIKKEDIKKIKVIKKFENKEEKAVNYKQGNKPRVDIVMVGGTISASLDAKTGGVSWLTSPEKLLKFYPEIAEIADIKINNPFMKASESMDSKDWLRIAKEVVRSLNDENVQGVIVTCGTDFAHYIGSALSFLIKDLNKPVAVTFSQRSTDRGSSDASLNLYCAAKIALSDIAEVMLVGHGSNNDDFCYALQANKARKMHTSRRDTFRAINTKPIAKVFKDKIEILREYNKKNKKKAIFENSFEEKTALIKFYPGQEPEIIDYYISKGYKGLIIEMCGLGHVITEGSKNWIPYIKKAVEKGMTICAAAQTLYGSLDPLVYSPGRELQKVGVIYLKDMLPETAFAKLGYVLGKTKNKFDIEKLMLTNLANEFNERLGEDFF